MLDNVLGACPCGLCGKSVVVKKTQPKKGSGRPYYKCDDCGFTAFCNMQESITMMMGKIKRIKPVKQEKAPVVPANDELHEESEKKGGWFL